MASLKAKAYLVDGGLMNIPLHESDLERLRSLQEQGLKGKALLHAFLTDDWGPPPLEVRVEGEDSEGDKVNIVIPYD